jgi:hypothetical protein
VLLDAVKREISECSKAGDFCNPAITELSVDASFKARKSPQQKEGPPTMIRAMMAALGISQCWSSICAFPPGASIQHLGAAM